MKRFHSLLFVFAAVLLVRAEAAPDIVFLVGDDEYKTQETVPAWARAELEPAGLECVYVTEKDGAFPGLEKLPEAKAFFISLRRRGLPPADMARVRAHVAAGKPVIGIRTASHALAPKKPEAGKESWAAFDREVLGHKYENHYGKGADTIASVPSAAAKHPVLAGLPAGPLRFTSHLYRCRELAPGTTLLLEGRLEGKDDVHEPLAWTWETEERRVFYTSLGSPEDFAQPAFRRLLTNAVAWALGKPISSPAK